MRLLRYTVNWTMHSTTVVHMVCCLLLKLYKLWGFLSGHQLEKPALSELLLNTQGIIHNIYTGELKQTRTWLLASWYTQGIIHNMYTGELIHTGYHSQHLYWRAKTDKDMATCELIHAVHVHTNNVRRGSVELVDSHVVYSSGLLC